MNVSVVPFAETVVEDRSPRSAAMRFFTICARNFLPSARILFESVRRRHPDAVFTVYLCDRDMGYDPDAFGMDIASLETLGAPDLEGMIRRYNITELCTAIKPFCILREFACAAPPGDSAADDGRETTSDARVVYLDPDIELFGPLEEVGAAFDAGAQMVLTPHVLGPAENAEHADQQYLRLGVYNLGFLAIRDTPAIRDAMRWWGRRLTQQCVIDVSNGLFVDQKWADLFPSFLDDVHILRHPGYNVAYWNLHERRIHGPTDALRVNGAPLRFVHYSGIILENVERLSRHSEMFCLSNSFGYGPLVSRYRARLTTPENRRHRAVPYGFVWDGAGGANLHAPRTGTGDVAWRQPSTFLFARQFFSREQYLDYKRSHAREIDRRRAYERSVTPDTGESFETQGYCFACGRHTTFTTSFLYSTETSADGRPIPNWREHVACRCGLPNRVRACLHLFLQEFEPEISAQIYITERKTRLYDWLAERFGNLVGSEYFGSRAARGAMVEGVRNENFEDLSFESGRFDYLLSFDVLEHVARPERAFAEAFRVLAPGGWLFFTAPAYLDRQETTIRAELRADGSIFHHLPPELHGNPVDPEGGALCFRYFGWDVMDRLRDVGFRRPFLYHYWSREFGYLGPDQAIFVAEKPA